jgi:hypothetical protein
MRETSIPRPWAKLVALLTITLLTAAGATAAHAQNRDALSALKTPRLADLSDRSAIGDISVQAPSCWTHFAPPAPDGIAMAQYYRNCNGVGYYVYAGYEIGGNRYQTHSCVWVPDTYYIFFYHSSTVQGANYGNWVC